MDKHEMFWYDVQRASWRQLMERQRAFLAVAFPETGGNPTYVHNWIVCGKDDSKREAALLILSMFHDRYERIRAYTTRRMNAARHADHVRRGEAGRYLWCDACMQAA